MAIRTALVSVSDKSGLIPLVRALAERGISILSSGGTAKALALEGIAVETVESYTGSPEVMDGRVKTLHPRVHGGILSRGERDRGDLDRIGAREIDLVVVNLYPFERVARDPSSSH
ncbi:MAG: bifunctional phosphoribosylaminoimidazolecarboxamide formyltransferase/IMP cyclohydrolase, partial [Polyangiaceae bacterium]